jgi:D-alanine--D-alanine ligase
VHKEKQVKIAVVYNRESRNVINLFGMANKETIGLKTIKRLTDALKKGGHSVIAFEGDKDLVDRLEHFMPRVVKGERPGMVFNVSYGIQGQARYTHVPSILEMVGIPYVASGPLAHSLALDKVVTKMILRQHGLPTPDFAVLSTPDAPLPELHYPMIVKPKNESVSFGLKVVNNERELREAAAVIFNEYQQPVLVEQYIEGREVNVGLLGNSPPEALPPVELLFGKDGPAIYTYEDKTASTSGRPLRSGTAVRPGSVMPYSKEPRSSRSAPSRRWVVMTAPVWICVSMRRTTFIFSRSTACRAWVSMGHTLLEPRPWGWTLPGQSIVWLRWPVRVTSGRPSRPS